MLILLYSIKFSCIHVSRGHVGRMAKYYFCVVSFSVTA